MKGLEYLIESAKLSKKMHNNLRVNNSITQLLEAQQQWKKQQSIFSMHDSLLKVIRQQHSDYAKLLSGADGIAKLIGLQSKFNIPTTAFDAINSINHQQKQFFGNLKNITDFLKMHSSAITQMNNLQFALRGISGQVATIAASQKDWSLLMDFQNFGEQAIEITGNNLNKEIVFTEAESIKFKVLIESIVAFLKRNKKFGIYSLLFIDIVLRIANFHQYYDFLKTKPELANKEDLVKFNRQMIQQIESKLKEEKEYRRTIINCKVMLKPKTNTLFLKVLPVGFEVIVLQINHKWAYVSYINPIDNLPQTGWVLKKYLNRPD